MQPIMMTIANKIKNCFSSAISPRNAPRHIPASANGKTFANACQLTSSRFRRADMKEAPKEIGNRKPTESFPPKVSARTGTITELAPANPPLAIPVKNTQIQIITIVLTEIGSISSVKVQLFYQ